MTSVAPDWYRARRYVHFDEPLGLAKAVDLVSDSSRIASHSFWPLIRFEVESVKLKRNPSTGCLQKILKSRPICYAAHGDSHVYSYVCSQLVAPYEREIAARNLGGDVLAFRATGKNNIDYANLAFSEIRARGDCTAIALDISGFFDHIDHGVLKAAWKRLLSVSELPCDHFAVFRSITRYAWVDRTDVFRALGVSNHNPRAGRRRLCSPADFRSLVRDAGLVNRNQTRFGIPQGTAISALLSNVYMLEFDSIAHEFAASVGGRYLRYCDDMLFIVPQSSEERVMRLVCEGVAKLKLELNPNKTDICRFSRAPGGQACSRPLQYLGFMFDGRRIIIRSAAFARFSNRMKRGVSLAKQTMTSRNKKRLAAGLESRELYRRKLMSRYSHLGRRNFVRYGYRAADVMNSEAIRRQLRPLWARLLQEIDK